MSGGKEGEGGKAGAVRGRMGELIASLRAFTADPVRAR